MRFIKTAWSMIDRLAKMFLVVIFIGISAILASFINVELGGTLYLITSILLSYIVYMMIKDDIKEFKEKVKIKMKEDKLKQ